MRLRRARFARALSVTGILLTVSTHWMRGFHYTFLSQFHAITVIFTLLYLPFGKFFHVFQRPAQLSLEFYRRAGAARPPARCTGHRRRSEPRPGPTHLAVIEIAVALLTLQAIGINRLAGIDYPLWAPRAAAASPAPGERAQPSDTPAGRGSST